MSTKESDICWGQLGIATTFIRELQDKLSTKDAEIEELTKRYEQLAEDALASERELAAVRAERDGLEKSVEHWKRMHHHAQDWADKHKARIEAAPKVWLWWRQDMHGNWFIKAAETDSTRWSGRTFCEGDRVEQVHAVLVDANEKEEGV